MQPVGVDREFVIDARRATARASAGERAETTEGGERGSGRDAWALAMADIVPMVSRGRRMRGWVRDGPDAFGDDDLRRRRIDAALGFVRSLPAK